MNAYSEDLRAKVVEYTESGHSRKETCEVFGVCLRSVTRWIKLKKETCSLKIDHVPRSPHKLFKEELTAYVKANPDAYMREIAEHFGCGRTTVHDALKRNGITYKKTPFICGAQRRATKKVYRFCRNMPQKSSGLR